MKRSRSQAGLEQGGRPSQDDSQQHLLPSQVHIQPLLDLDSSTAPLVRVQLLNGHLPFPRILARWQDNQRDEAMYYVRLVGDVEQPDKWTGIALHYLTCHSDWAAVRDSTNLQTSGSLTVLPICIAPEVVHKIIESLYSGFLDISCDVEQMLLMADCLQVSLMS